MISRASLPVSLLLLLAACENGDTVLPLVGTLERDRIELVADARESIVRMMVREGDAVMAGDVVFELDPALRRAELRVAEAQRDAAAQRLAELVRGPRQERIREARARLDGARENLTIRTSERDRIAALVERRLASDADLDRVRDAREAAEAEVAALTAALDELLEGTTAEELSQAQARLDEADARVELARIALERLTVTAPRNGTIDALTFKAGETPSVGATVVVMLAQEPVYARVYVPEPLRARVVPGLEARISIDGLPSPLAARVRYVSSDAVFTPYFSLTQRDRSRLAYLAEVDVTDAAAGLPVGQPVEVDFPGLQ